MPNTKAGKSIFPKIFKGRELTSPFFEHSRCAQTSSLGILFLKRDLQTPVVLDDENEIDEGYKEGRVINTRFGSFPHSTLVGVEWGAQVSASVVDTGSRGRKSNGLNRKRKRDDEDIANQSELEESGVPKAAVPASTGFIHLLPPTPESWTTSLPHRTQVVYTPDYSYILQRLRARPGSVLIEAGAGSGSFTHAAARAVYGQGGRVWSYEFHERRVETLVKEIKEHGLDPVVRLTHRDVCDDGFSIAGETVHADAVFLDLPAPWLALKHLSRNLEQSPLNPDRAVHICTFSPCIEQVQRTVAELRASGWVEVDMAEISARRIEVRRDRVGLQEEGLRGVNPCAASVEEAISKLRELEQQGQLDGQSSGENAIISRVDRLASIRNAQAGRKIYHEGTLVHRAEPELKTHTSYLVFATLPRAWNEDDERRLAESAPIQAPETVKSRRQMKREYKERQSKGE